MQYSSYAILYNQSFILFEYLDFVIYIRFSHAWVLLGHVLATQEESEHAISAYRTACRVSPGDLHPQIAMAKELVRAFVGVKYSRHVALLIA